MFQRFALAILCAATAAFALSASVSAWAATPFYLETWENGTDGWTSKTGASDPVTLPLDPSAPMHEDFRLLAIATCPAAVDAVRARRAAEGLSHRYPTARLRWRCWPSRRL